MSLEARLADMQVSIDLWLKQLDKLPRAEKSMRRLKESLVKVKGKLPDKEAREALEALVKSPRYKGVPFEEEAVERVCRLAEKNGPGGV